MNRFYSLVEVGEKYGFVAEEFGTIFLLILLYVRLFHQFQTLRGAYVQTMENAMNS